MYQNDNSECNNKIEKILGDRLSTRFSIRQQHGTNETYFQKYYLTQWHLLIALKKYQI